MAITLRPGTAADAEQCGQIIFEAFGAIPYQHNFPTDFPVPVSLVMDNADPVSTNTNASPFIYTFGIDFTLTINNTGADTIELHDIENLLPPGFSTLLIDPSGDIIDGLKSGTPEWGNRSAALIMNGTGIQSSLSTPIHPRPSSIRPWQPSPTGPTGQM
ncbi:MAG: hypothetical protein FI710_13280 [SAR202 cluster bacterium]|nr:hypothetical protein [SAR202 cluster bacterium]